ncbi:hypothetical protein [Candidatus Magnetaquiglobus chichijimensis]|uniref:hypothetical protein n=1 Tax=Candidatus Magnetaquiglobus chichijimensis TaxID=3141448 RepID=UPI003B970882
MEAIFRKEREKSLIVKAREKIHETVPSFALGFHQGLFPWTMANAGGLNGCLS